MFVCLIQILIDFIYRFLYLLYKDIHIAYIKLVIQRLERFNYFVLSYRRILYKAVGIGYAQLLVYSTE